MKDAINEDSIRLLEWKILTSKIEAYSLSSELTQCGPSPNWVQNKYHKIVN